MLIFCWCKQKTAYEMCISDWSSDVCSSDLSSRGEIWPATIGFFLPTRSESQPKNTNQNRPAKAPAPTTSSAAEFSMRCGPVRKNSAPYMAVYQMTVSPAEIGRASWRDRVGQYV